MPTYIRLSVVEVDGAVVNHANHRAVIVLRSARTAVAVLRHGVGGVLHDKLVQAGAVEGLGMLGVAIQPSLEASSSFGL